LLGWNGWRITSAIFNREGELVFFKRARAPEDKSEGPKMIAWSGPIVLICGPRNNSCQNRPILNRNTLQGQRTLKSETEEIAIENGVRAGGRTESSVFEQGGLTMELPRDISGKATAVIAAGLLLITFFAYRGYVNSRQALQILDLQVPNITRVAFDTQVFALTPANLEPILTSVAAQFGGTDGAEKMAKLKKEFDSHLWIAVMIRNKGLQSATEVLTRVQLTAPITALQGFSSTGYASMEVKEGGIGKETASVNWNYIEPAITAVTLIGVQPKDFGGKPPYSTKDMRTWSRDFRLYFELAQVKSKEGAIAYAY